MNQILHIFKKDARHHWPEILISLALLALYTRREFHFWRFQRNSFSSPFLMFLSAEYIAPALIIFWIFLILRVVHSETLVGETQWWVTKPYVWWKLLLAKLLFIFIFVAVPLFHVQLLLLHHAGFPVFANLGKVCLMEFSALLLLLASSFTLATLTKNLGQAFIGIGIFVVIVIGGLWLASRSTQDALVGSSEPWDFLEPFLVFAPMAIVPIWQFARRKTWFSRGVIAAGLGLAFLGSYLPHADRIEQSYPLVVGSDAPAKFSVVLNPDAAEGKQSLTVPNAIRTMMITITVNATGVAPSTFVHIDGIKLTSGSPAQSRLSRGWLGQFANLWPEDQRINLTYAVDRQEYENVKSQSIDLHVQLLLSEYQESDARTLLLPAVPFKDSQLGTCQITGRFGSELECLQVFKSPSYVARFDVRQSPCVDRDDNKTDLNVAYSWAPPSQEFFPVAGLNPVVNYNIWFAQISPVSDYASAASRGSAPASPCPGSEIQIGHPTFKRQVRMEFDIPNVRLLDLATVSSLYR